MSTASRGAFATWAVQWWIKGACQVQGDCVQGAIEAAQPAWAKGAWQQRSAPLRLYGQQAQPLEIPTNPSKLRISAKSNTDGPLHFEPTCWRYWARQAACIRLRINLQHTTAA